MKPETRQVSSIRLGESKKRQDPRLNSGKKVTKESSFNRRAFLIGIGSVGVVGIGAVEVFSRTGESDNDIIKNYIIGSGINNLEEQKTLSELFPYTRDPRPMNTNDEEKSAEDHINEMIRSVVGVMEKSTIPLLKSTGRDLDIGGQQDTIMILASKNLDGLRPEGLMKPANSINRNEDPRGVIEQVILVDTEKFNNGTSGIEVAVSLVHQRSHANSGIKYLAKISHQTSDPEELSQLLIDYESRPDVMLNQEVNALADQAEVIINILQTGYTMQLSADWTEFTAMYIRSGLRRESQKWRKYVQQRLGFTPIK